MTDFKDTLTVLEAHGDGQMVAKRWVSLHEKPTPVDQPLLWHARHFEINDLHHFQKFLLALSRKPDKCIIRGAYKGDADKVSRRSAMVEDVPHRWCVFDFDHIEAKVPMAQMSADELDAAVRDALDAYMPEAFKGVDCVWQASASAGHPTTGNAFKFHAVFWLETPYSSADLKAWAEGLGTDRHFDQALFQPVQIHYTASPVFAEGLSDPLAKRMGFLQGGRAHVPLVISKATLAQAEAKTKQRDTMADPRDKPGLVGLFCQSVGPARLVEDLLADQLVWQNKAKGRITWISPLNGGAKGGVKVTDDQQHLTASHDSWPLGANRASNTFDVMRALMFGHLDEEIVGQFGNSIEAHTRPSHKAMVRWCRDNLSMVQAGPATTLESLPDVPAPPVFDVGAELELELAIPEQDAWKAWIDYGMSQSWKYQPELLELASIVGMASCLNGNFTVGEGRLGRSGLNLFGLLVSGTGTGKDVPLSLAEDICSHAGGKLLGRPASGEGLADALIDTHGMLVKVDEVGTLFSCMSDPKASPHLKTLNENILQLWSSSGKSFQPRLTARSKGKTENLKPLDKPCLSFVGAQTPEKLGEGLSESEVLSGLVGRFMLRMGREKPLVNTGSKDGEPAEWLLDRCEQVRAAASAFIDTHTVKRDAEAEDMFRRLIVSNMAEEEEALDRQDPIRAAVIKRCAEKISRLAAVLAVWDNPRNPEISGAMMRRACAFVKSCDADAIKFFKQYIHGGQVMANAAKIKRSICKWLSAKTETDHAYRLKGMVPHRILTRNLNLEKLHFDRAIEQLKHEGQLCVVSVRSSEIAKNHLVCYQPTDEFSCED